MDPAKRAAKASIPPALGLALGLAAGADAADVQRLVQALSGSPPTLVALTIVALWWIYGQIGHLRQSIDALTARVAALPCADGHGCPVRRRALAARPHRADGAPAPAPDGARQARQDGADRTPGPRPGALRGAAERTALALVLLAAPACSARAAVAACSGSLAAQAALEGQAAATGDDQAPQAARLYFAILSAATCAAATYELAPEPKP